jgi:2-oxo-4-hydroxy-4-carboxy-5-ureidoimidazoline decarboxylase
MSQSRQRPTNMSRSTFVASYGPVYEHSPWIAEALYAGGLDESHDTAEGLASAMRAVVEAASPARRLDLLRAHPDLAGRLALRGELTAQSSREQSGAGLDSCSPEELQRFTTLNEAYTARFGFPFIMAVRGASRAQILAAFERRLGNDAGVEFRTALDEVHKIALFRLRDLLC